MFLKNVIDLVTLKDMFYWKLNKLFVFMLKTNAVMFSLFFSCLIGRKGLSDEVFAETERALENCSYVLILTFCNNKFLKYPTIYTNDLSMTWAIPITQLQYLYICKYNVGVTCFRVNEIRVPTGTILSSTHFQGLVA